MDKPREKESRHLWVGGLPDDVDEGGIKDYFSRYGKIEGVKILPQKYPNIGVAAFVDFFDVKSAIDAKEAKLKWNGNELRANFKFDKSEGVKSHDRERHDGKESASSSSDSDSGSSSSSSSSDSENDSSGKRKKKVGSVSGGSSSPLFIKATGLADRPDRVLQDGLYYEFCRFSTDVVVKMYTKSDKKWAIIKYKRGDRCRDAFSQLQGMMLYGSKIKLSLMEVDEFPPGGRDQSHMTAGHGGADFATRLNMLDDLDPKATRSLFVGNIPKHINVYDLRDAFIRYGTVLDVEIKKMGGNATYGFILYYDLLSAVTAKHYMDGHNIKGNTLRVGFGKGTASKQVWLDGMDPNISDSQLERNLSKYGKVVRIGIDRYRCCAMVQYDTMESAKEALNAVRGTIIGSSRKLMTDFANRDARAAFFSHMDAVEAGLPGPFPGPHGHMYDMHGGRGMVPGGSPGMMMGRGGYGPPHGPGHPMDYFYQPGYGMEYYGGGRPHYGPPGMGRYPSGPYGRDNDYDEELRAYSRKRELEKRIGGGSGRRRYSSSSDSGDSSGDNRRKGSKGDGEDGDMDDDNERSSRKKANKPKDRGKKGGRKGDSDSDSEDQEEGARIKATRKSRDLREKLKRKALARKVAEASSDDDGSDEDTSKHAADDDLRQGKKKQDEKMDVESKEPLTRSVKDRRSSSSTPEIHRSGSPRSSSTKRRPSDDDSDEAKALLQKRSRESVKSRDDRSDDDNSPRRRVRKSGESIQGSSRNGALSEDRTPPHLRKSKPKEPDGFGDQGDSSDEGSKSSRRRSHEVFASSKSRSSKRRIDDTPQSPVMSITKSSPSPRRPAVGSDLSSGDDFREGGNSQRTQSKEQQHRRGVRRKDSDGEGSKSHSRRRPQTPDYPTEEPDRKGGGFPRTPPLSDKPDHSDAEDGRGSSRGMRESSRSSRKLPRRYQPESGGDAMSGSIRRDAGNRYRESKEGHQERRFHGQQASSPSPPPHMGRKKFHHSPPQQQNTENFEQRRRWRGRGFSPGASGVGGGAGGGGGGGGGFQRRLSPSFQSPQYRGKSPYGSPHRGRSPVQRSRTGRFNRFDNSPPFDSQQRQKFRGRSSPSPNQHRYPHSPSPPPRNTARSPPGRRFRQRSGGSVSPPRMPRMPRRVDRSPVAPDYPRSSPRSEDRYELGKRRKRQPYSPPPSPKDGKYRMSGKDADYPDVKRRRMEENRPKSPSVSPPPIRESSKPEPLAKISRQQAHHVSQPSSEQRGSKASTHRQQVLPPASLPPEPPSTKPSAAPPSHPSSQPVNKSQSAAVPAQENSLINLLRRYPVMWQGHLMLKNDAAAVQLHFLSGNLQLAQSCLPGQGDQQTPVLRISQRMRLEKSQLEGVDRRIQAENEHCLLLALPCGKDASDVVTQTNALQANLINYLLQKQAAGIINVQGPQARGGYVLHIFPPCSFSQSHLSRAAPDLLSTATDNCHLMIVVATM